jgi:NitT/TauT family transport system substrate-binding protein
MKKFIIWLLILIIIFVTLKLTIFKKTTTSDLETVKVAEVTHSIFYAPFYVAIENNYFKDEGLNIDLILTSGADKVSAAVLSNDVNIGFAGPESTIYVYNGGESDYLVSFAGLTKRDGQFIVSHKQSDFNLNDLKGKEILVGRKGGMPALNFLNALANAGIKQSDININYSVDFASLSGSFISGIGDYVNLFEPNATKLEEQSLGYVVASVGKLSGEVPYTAFNARKSYIANNQTTIAKFRNALNKGLEYVKNNSAEDTATVILPQFPDTSLKEITKIVKRYKDNDTWYENTEIKENAFKNLEDIMIKNNLLDNYVNFNDLVSNE